MIEYRYCYRGDHNVTEGSFLNPQDGVCVFCRVKANEERPIRPLLGVLFRVPKPHQKKVAAKAINAVH